MEKSFSIQKGRVCAAEIHTSGYCNMDCEYCFIPKVDSMKELHKEIEADLKSGKYIERLWDLYGDDLETISLWGTEPTLTLDLFINKLDDFMERFPKLRSIGFSTNFITKTKSIERLIDKAEEVGKKFIKEGETGSGRRDRWGKFTISLQISIDGPSFITDKYRQKGAVDTIVKNFESFLLYVENKNLVYTRIEGNFKPTISIDFIRKFNRDINLFDQYFSFFQRLYDKINFEKINSQNFVFYVPGSSTLMVPGSYTVSDGREWALYQRNLKNYANHITRSKKFKNYRFSPNDYLSRLRNMISGFTNFVSNPASQTCSGGDSMWAVDYKDILHLCHRSFFMGDGRYREAINHSDKYQDNWDVTSTKKGKIDNVIKNLSVNINDEFEVSRLTYVLRGFHEQTSFRISTVFALITCLSKYGQASRIYYENEDIATLFAAFIVATFGCSTENAICAGSIHLTPISLVRLWGNGAFEELLDSFFDSPFDTIKLAENGGTLK